MNEPLKGVAPQLQVQTPQVQQPVQQQQVAQPAAQASASEQQVAPVQQADPVRERTSENFNQLLESNNKLFAQQQAQSVLIEQLLAGQQKAQIAQQPVAPKTEAQSEFDFIFKHPVTGEEMIDRDKMQASLTAIQARALNAEKQVEGFIQSTRQQERSRQESEAFTAFPELNPNSAQYDAKFNNFTRALITDSMLNQRDYGGRALTYKEAAEQIRSGARPTQESVIQAATEPATPDVPSQAQINKEQAAASIVSQPQQAQADISAEELNRSKLKTRLGDDKALAERLMHTEHIYGQNSVPGNPTQ